jgi:fructosamine-3-kinase
VPAETVVFWELSCGAVPQLGDNVAMEPQHAARIAALGDGLHRVVLDDGRRAVVKRRRAAPAGFFAMEAHGLELLRATQTLRVPLVHALTGDSLVLEDLGTGHAEQAAWERAGRALATLHRHASPAFGLDRNGWCGNSAQLNTPMADGHRFFAECRLLPQARRAYDAGRLTQADVEALERLANDLPSRIPPQPASLIHGDLWTGNLHACADGELALIDAAAVHYGWAEAELAMLTLFGEPPAALFAAYEAEAGTGPSWRTRAPFYNLYHLLNHLNLFGAAYLDSVRRVLRRA